MSRFIYVGNRDSNIKFVAGDGYVDRKNRTHPSGTVIIGDVNRADRLPFHFKDIYSAARGMAHALNTQREVEQRLSGHQLALATTQQVLALPGNHYSPSASQAMIASLQKVVQEEGRARKPEKKQFVNLVARGDVRGSKGRIIPAASSAVLSAAERRLQTTLDAFDGSKEGLERAGTYINDYIVNSYHNPVVAVRKEIADLRGFLFRQASPEDWGTHHLLDLLKSFPKFMAAPYNRWLPLLITKLTEWAKWLKPAFSRMGFNSGPLCANTDHHTKTVLELIRAYQYVASDLHTISCKPHAVAEDVLGEKIIERLSSEVGGRPLGDLVEKFQPKFAEYVAPFINNNDRRQSKNYLEKLLKGLDQVIMKLLQSGKTEIAKP